jgi:hypothetical protein
VANGVIFFLLTLVGSVLIDATVRPHDARRWRRRGMVPHLLAMAALFGGVLGLTGNGLVSAALATAFMTLFAITSNAKHAMLGEPLLFSDLALIAGLVRHPRFYFTAVSTRQRWLLAIGMAILLPALLLLFVPRAVPHLIGLALLLVSLAGLSLLLRPSAAKRLAPLPDVDSDVARYGLITTLLVYWRRWRASPDPLPCPAFPARREGRPIPEVPPPPDIVVIVQCESFADPVELTGTRADALVGLERARALAWQWGDLAVSGFGAYTMRTEYGVLFGRSEADLGFRRYDPFLTARAETSYALPARLGGYGYRNLFVHPHDMRFYGRDRLMPAIGFDRLIGEEGFTRPTANGGRYVDDRTLGAALGELIDTAAAPTFIYAVTMENHGPWDTDRSPGSPGGLDAYLNHVRSSDAMLTALIERLSAARRSAILVFFGDHRPSIPGVTEPEDGRHTPYVMLRFSEDGDIVRGDNRRRTLSPDQLHHAILGAVTE